MADSEYWRIALAHLRGCLKHSRAKHIRRKYKKAIQFGLRKLEIAERTERMNPENCIYPAEINSAGREST